MSEVATRTRGAERRRAILDATLRLIGRHGGGAVTHRAVAAEAGVPLAATTYYFASKDELIREAFALAVDEDVAEIRALAPPPDAGLPAVAAHLAHLLGTRRRDLLLVQYELELEAARRPELAPVSRAWTDAYVDAIAPLLAALGSGSAERDAWIVCASLSGMALEALASHDAQPRAAEIERLLAALVQPGSTEIRAARADRWIQAQPTGTPPT